MCPTTFIGTFPCDVLNRFVQPKPTQPKVMLVCNLAPSHIQNGHFIAISISWKESKIYVFCSLCLAFSDPNVVQFLTRFLHEHPGFKILSSPFPIQSKRSLFCAVHSLAFLASQSIGEDFETFYDRFRKTDLDKNDQISLNFLLSYIINYTNKK